MAHPRRVWAPYASRWTKLSELEAEVGRTEALYTAVTEEGRVAEEESSSLTAVRARLEREMTQIGAETTVVAMSWQHVVLDTHVWCFRSRHFASCASFAALPIILTCLCGLLQLEEAVITPAKSRFSNCH